MFRLLATLVLAAIAVFQAQAIIPADCDRTATVAAGDTCNGISAKYNVSTYQLATVNNGTIDAACDNLQVDSIICLGLTGQDCSTTHVVHTGETCIAIADTYNISQSTLLANNPNVTPACTNLYPDEVLCVSGTIYVNQTTAESK